ncbi:MAG: hypothetical protein N2511_08080 [Thermodesulfovibrionales bacterium]|nr:hypothetical protein [Thermodesulfovibrionales bacterium]
MDIPIEVKEVTKLTLTDLYGKNIELWRFLVERGKGGKGRSL